MPRPRRIAEQEKIKAWAVSHPKEGDKMQVAPEHHVLPKEWRLWLWASAMGIALFLLAPKLSGEKVTVLFVLALLTFEILLVIPLRKLPWIISVEGNARRNRKLTAYICTFAVTGLLGWLSFPNASPQAKAPSTASETIATQPPVQKSTAPNKREHGVTLDNVHVENFGSTQMVNEAGQLNMKNSTVAGGKVGLDNRNPHAQINMDNSSIDGGEIGVVNRGPAKRETSLKQRALLLANELEEFDQLRRNESWNEGIQGHEEEAAISDKSKALDNQTILKFRAQFRKRIIVIVTEFHAKGLNTLNVPSVDERLANWNWNGKNHGASQIAVAFSQCLRKLAEQIDDKGNLIH